MSNILTANGGGDELQNVVNLASSGDIILIEDGIYNPIIIDKDLTLSAKNEVNLLNNTASVFIKCNDVENNPKRCVTVTDLNLTVKLYGLCLENGYTTSSSDEFLAGTGGGALYIKEANRCLFVNCYSSYTGGAGFANKAKPTILKSCNIIECKTGTNSAAFENALYYNCKIKNCYSPKHIIYNGQYFENCLIENCKISSNSKIITTDINDGRELIIKNSVFRNNSHLISNDLNSAIIDGYNTYTSLFYNNENIVGLLGKGGLINCTFVDNYFKSNIACDISSYNTFYTNNGFSVINNIFNESRVIIDSNYIPNRHVYYYNNICGFGCNIDYKKEGYTPTYNHISNNHDIQNAVFKLEHEHDYRLREGSIGIDDGFTDNGQLIVETDFEGKPYDKTPSIGAYQYEAYTTQMPNYLNPLAINKPYIQKLYDSEVEYIDAIAIETFHSYPGNAQGNPGIVTATGDIGGGQIINTGVIPNYKTSFEVKTKCLISNDLSVYEDEYPLSTISYLQHEFRTGTDNRSLHSKNIIFGFNLNPNNWSSIVIFNSYTEPTLSATGDGLTKMLCQYKLSTGHICTYSYDAQSYTMKYINHNTNYTKTSTMKDPSIIEGLSCSNPFCLFGRFAPYTSKNVQFHGAARIYHAKFWDDGELIRDFIPVRIGRIGYLFDKVEQKLYSARRLRPGPDVV